MEDQQQNKFDWLKFWIHFALGLVFGLFCGIPAVIYLDLDSVLTVCIALTAIALIYGILAGIRGDRFWFNIHDWLWPWR